MRSKNFSCSRSGIVSVNLVLTLTRCLGVAMVFAGFGCSQKVEHGPVAKLPRPVTVISLREQDPAHRRNVTGAVGSWKTESIGFEVSGRVNYVIEPEQDVVGAPLVRNVSNLNNPDLPEDASGDSASTVSPASSGTVIATLDEHRYRIQVASAAAQVDVARRKQEAIQIDIDKVMPAERMAARAAFDLAEIQFGRSESLIKQDAIAQAEVDQARANRDKSQASLDQIDAGKVAREAEVRSLDAQIEQAMAALEDAQRNLQECTLRAPFRGQVAAVHVLPGGYVQAGQPVVTVQMMDPIKIEFEVSAEQVRRLNYKDEVTISGNQADGSTFTDTGIVYTTDATADSSTRTFTISVLMRNQKQSPAWPDDVKDQKLPVTREVSRLISGILDDSARRYVGAEGLQHDDEGDYLWRVVERIGGLASSLFKVEKLRVKAGPREASFLGLWTFREVEILPDQNCHPETDIFIGAVELHEENMDWQGGLIQFERNQWRLRPGDLVNVDVSGVPLPKGFYVPMDCIHRVGGQSCVFAVSTNQTPRVVKRVPVETSAGIDTLVRIESDSLKAGDQLVAGGVHYVVDGEAVNVVAEVEVP